MADPKEEKKEKDPNAKITGWDVLDPQSLTRKVPIGPKFEDLSRSKTYEMLGNEERPTSHKVKDTTAAVMGVLPIILSATGVFSNTNKAAKKGISLVVGKILDKAVDSSKIKNIIEHADEVKKIAKGYDDAVDVLNNKKSLYNALSKDQLEGVITGHPSWANPDKVKNAGKDVIESIESVKSYIDMMDDYAKGMPLKKLAQKYANLPKEEINKFVKKANLTGNTEEDFFKFLIDNKVKNIDDLDKAVRATGGRAANSLVADEAYDKLDNIGADIFEKYVGDLKPGESKVLAGEDFENFVKEMRKAQMDAVKAGEQFTSEKVEDMVKNFRKELVKETKDSLKEVNDYGNTVENVLEKGKSVARTNKDKAYIRGDILSKAKKDKKYLDTFENIVNPKDPYYKFLNRIDLSQSANKFGLEDAIRETGSVTDAIQKVALDKAIKYYDEQYVDTLSQAMKIGSRDPANPLKLIDIEVKNNPFRNTDGSLKSIDDIVKILATEPKYIENVTKLVNDIASSGKNYTAIQTSKAIGYPLMAQYINRGIKNETLNQYDPYGKKNAIEKPWNPKLEFGKVRQGFDNLLNVFNVNFDLDPSRYTKSDIKAIREAITYANNIYKTENPKQISTLSDREILNLARSIGYGNYGDEFRQEAIKKLSEIAPRVKKEKK